MLEYQVSQQGALTAYQVKRDKQGYEIKVM